MASIYSDLEVAPKNTTPPAQPGLEYDHYVSDRNLQKAEEKMPLSGTPRYQICGLSPKWFWITVVAIVFIVVAGAVGGGVGGSLATKSKTTDATEGGNTSSSSSINTAAQGQNNTSSSSTPTPTSPQEISTTQIIGPTFTLTRDCPSSNNSLYNVALGTTQMTFRKICGASYLNTLDGGQGNVVIKRTNSLDGCINLCAAYNVQNATAIAAGTNNVCNAVCWRNSLDNDDWPSVCFGFTTQNSSNALVSHQEMKCDSAAWIDQKFI